MIRPTILTSGRLRVVSTAFGACHVVPVDKPELVLASVYVANEQARAVDKANAETIALLPELVGVLSNLVELNHPDSLLDQRTDMHLKVLHEDTWVRARDLLEKVTP
jgi:hypothetical protein